MKTVLFYDTETTGLPDWKSPSGSETQPHIVQIGAILCDAESQKIIKNLNVIIQPDGWEIPQETIDVHGITNEFAQENGIPEAEAVKLLLDLCGDADRVAYNKTFDQRIIRIALKRFFDEEVQDKWGEKENHHCAMIMSKKICKIEPKGRFGYKNPKLTEAYKHFFDEEFEGAHDAMADAKACMRIYWHIKNNKLEA